MTEHGEHQEMPSDLDEEKGMNQKHMQGHEGQIVELRLYSMRETLVSLALCMLVVVFHKGLTGETH